MFTSVVCYCQNGLRRKHGKCSLCNEWLCNEWWHSFMNQRLIGSFIRWYGRPVELPLVIIVCLFTSGAQWNEWKDINKLYHEWKIRRCSISTHKSTYFLSKQHLFSYIHTPMCGFHWSILHLHIRYYCALRHGTGVRNVGHRVYYVALR